jgi:hypothetical protein
MNPTRRGFLSIMLAAAAAPAIVRSDSLMRSYMPRPILPTLWGDGMHDDAAALQALFDGKPVQFGGHEFRASLNGEIALPSGNLVVASLLTLGSGTRLTGSSLGTTIRSSHPFKVAPGTRADLSNLTFE